MSHTSATLMGTDWRDNDRSLEPLVEIYQGDRMSYEHEESVGALHVRRRRAERGRELLLREGPASGRPDGLVEPDVDHGEPTKEREMKRREFLGKAGATQAMSVCIRVTLILSPANSSNDEAESQPYSSRRPSRAFDIVTSSANSRSLPTGTPRAIRLTLTPKGFNNLER